MIEFVLFPLVVGGVMVMQEKFKKRMDERKVIEQVFENTKCFLVRNDGSKNKLKFKKKVEHEWGREYFYKLPLGMNFYKVVSIVYVPVSNALNREIEMDFSKDGYMSICVFNKALPTFVPFKCNTEQLVRDWSVPIGVTQKGEVVHDFTKSFHMGIGGTTGYGKTEVVRLMTSLLILKQPDNVHFEIIDLKGGLNFIEFKNVRQVHSVAYRPKDALARLRIVAERINERLDEFLVHGWKNLKQSPYNDRTFIIIDEAAELVPKDKKDKLLMECQSILEYIARVAGQLGFHLIYTTQYPTADVFPRQIKQNCDARLAFRIPNEMASKVLMDETGAEELPHGVPGRAIYKTDKIETIQTYYMKDEEVRKILDIYHVVQEVEQCESEPQTEVGENREDTLFIG